MFDLGMACKDDLLDDYDNDIILIIEEYQRATEKGIAKMFLCKQDGENAGIVWVDLDTKGIGYLHAGLMPKFRKGFTALYFIRLFVQYCFETLKLRSVEAHFPTTNKRAETLVRRIGFRKYGLKPHGTTINGKPISHVLLALTQFQYKGLKNGQPRRK